MRLGVIYKVSIGNNFIIGSTLTPNDRRLSYLSKLRRNKYTNSYVQDSFNKYGEEVFKFEYLQRGIPEEILEHVEDIWIGVLCGRTEDKKGGMNMRDAARVRHSQESKNKISTSGIGRKMSQKNKEKLFVANSIKCFQYDLQGNFIKEWESISLAAIYIKGYTTLISKCCNPKNSRKTHNGFMWFYDYKGQKINSYKRNNPKKKK